VNLPGVGRVDLIIDGWLIVECDSRAHHRDWAAQVRDKRRDIAAAGLGYTTIRPVAEDIYYDFEQIRVSMQAIIRSRQERAPSVSRRSPRRSAR
jgi:very-short-patch-repair endonuclease